MYTPVNPSSYESGFKNRRKFLSAEFLQRVYQYHKQSFSHYENTPIQLYWKFYHQKMKIFN